jgi:hypothetical protein
MSPTRDSKLLESKAPVMLASGFMAPTRGRSRVDTEGIFTEQMNSGYNNAQVWDVVFIFLECSGSGSG